MMKNLLMGSVACALILASCNKNEVMENIDSGNGQLTFSPAIGKQTRAAEIMNSTLTGEATSSNPIKLYAYQNTGTSWGEWFNDKLYYDDVKWQITSTRFRNTSATKYITFWPQINVSMTDAEWNASNFVDLFPEFGYEVKSGADEITNKQYDLIAGITDLEANKTDVVFKMRHLLSQVNFGVKGYNGAQITIKSITVKNVYSTGKYEFKANDGSDDIKNTVGTWTPTKDQDQTYSYKMPTATAVPAVAANAENVTTGDKYIFGDGGNFGPGKVSGTFYPTGANGAWEQGNSTLSGKLDNSLMLIPQDLTNAMVTFKYTIQDKAGAYVAGTAGDGNEATGTFALDFKTATAENSGTTYFGKWEQNYRYVYIIDFTDFLDDNALTFKVDVEAFPWENYNADGVDDGVVKIAEIERPTEPTINAMASGDTYYIASRTAVAPSVAEKAQLLADYEWNWTSYDFAKIAGKTDEKITINFKNVIFNGKTITLTLPTGYTATNGTGITKTGNVFSTGDKSVDATIIITNKTSYNDDDKLKTAVELVNTNGEVFAYTGTTPVDLTGYTMALTTDGNTLTIDFSKSTIIPTVSGEWSWNTTTKVATYVTSKTLAAAITEFSAVIADGVTIYCYDAANIVMATEFGEPTDVTGMTSGDKVTVVFNVANASRVVGAGTTNGVWATTDNKTYTWTKN